MPSKDTVAKRKAQIQYLATQFKMSTTSSYEYTMVNEADMASGTGRKLFILGHGNQNSYMGQNAQTMFSYLKDRGLSSQHFSEIWLMPCKVGLQQQDNSVTQNFARDLKTALVDDTATKNIKLYAPRGIVRSTYTAAGVCTNIFVPADGKNYNFIDGGWLLVGGSGTW